MEIAAPGAGPDFFIGQLGEGDEFFDERRHDGRSRRRDEFGFGAGRINGNPFQELGHGGRRHGQDSVRRLDPALAHVEGGCIKLAGLEFLGEQDAAQDVDEGVIGACLVEMCLREFTAMNLGLGLEKIFENGQGAGLDGL